MKSLILAMLLLFPVTANAVTVSSSSELETELAKVTKQTILVQDGIYSSLSYFNNKCNHDIIAVNVKQVTFTSGLVVGGNSCNPGQGTEISGIKFDVSDHARVLHDSVIHVWGTGDETAIVDVEIDGNDEIGHGVLVRSPEGFIASRLDISNLTSTGITVSDNSIDTVLSSPALVSDVVVSNVSRDPPRSSNGTSEACIWIGDWTYVVDSDVSDCAWMGIWFGTSSQGSGLTNVTVDGSPEGIGVYFERYSRDIGVLQLDVGPNVKIGVVCEWANPSVPELPGCNRVIIQDSTIDTTCAGVILDEGTISTTVRGTTFSNQQAFAIGDYKGVRNLWDTLGNSYEGIGPRAVDFYELHSVPLMDRIC